MHVLKIGVGALLLQEHKNQVDNLVCYIFKKFNQLAIILTIQHFEVIQLALSTT